MQRLTIYVPDSMATDIRADADTKGQSLSTWFTRAAESALIESDLTPKDWSKRVPKPAKRGAR